MNRFTRRRGLTLTDVLVTIGVIVLFVVIVLPAFSPAKSAAWRARCQNNLRQFGVALNNYEVQLGTFPPGLSISLERLGNNDGDSPDFRRLVVHQNAFAALLPFIEQGGLDWRLDPQLDWADLPANAYPAAVLVFTCPAASHDNPAKDQFLLDYFNELESRGIVTFAEKPQSPPFGTNDYLLSKGVSDGFCLMPSFVVVPSSVNDFSQGYPTSWRERGMFDLSVSTDLPLNGTSLACTPKMIRDGLSNTFAIGEGSVGSRWRVCDDRVGGEVSTWLPDGSFVPAVGNDPRRPCLPAVTPGSWTKRPLPAMQMWHQPPNFRPIADAGIKLTGPFGCTLEPLNKNPVTQTVMDITFDPRGYVDLSRSIAALTNCRPSVDWDGPPVEESPELRPFKDWPDHPAPPGPASRDRVSNFRSEHRGGANFVMADGSVHFISENISPNVYRALSTIAGEEEFDPPF